MTQSAPPSSAGVRHARAGRPVLGICGGLQMLGDALLDPDGVDGEASGLGLLPLTTRFAATKLLRHTGARFTPLAAPWAALSNLALAGYEIRHGRTAPTVDDDADLRAVLHNGEGDAIGWQRGNVLGVYTHGLFEQPAVLQALFGAEARSLDAVCDGLADFIDTHFEPGVLARLLETAP